MIEVSYHPNRINHRLQLQDISEDKRYLLWKGRAVLGVRPGLVYTLFLNQVDMMSVWFLLS